MRGAGAPAAAVVAIPAVAIMLVAACNPPGWLWESEAGGYDVLEYHLQLPQEWIRLGRLQPLDHNVYSFLPGYVEAAFYHLAAMMGAPAAPQGLSRTWGLLAGDGVGVLSCQWLSVGIAILAAVLVGRLVMQCGRAAVVKGDARSEKRLVTGATLAGALLLCTPWTVVVGSMAYNDLGVVVLLAGAMIAAFEDGLKPWSRGAIVGLLVGFACGCKPTAIFLAGVPAGIVLLGATPRRWWWAAAGAGTVTGLLAIAPWMTRNWLASGNPVFPFGASIFGSAHWTAEQVARYGAAHADHGPLLYRIGLLFLADPNDPAGPRHRGLLHPQWFIFFPMTVLAAAIAAIRRPLRPVVGLLTISLLAQVGAWIFLTHIQSRFLLPLAVPSCALFGLAATRPEPRTDRATALLTRARVGTRATSLLAPAACLLQAGAALVIFTNQRGGKPNTFLQGGPGVRTGAAFTSEERAGANAALGPDLYVNFNVPSGRIVYLLGGSTPLYFTADVLYNTTWDRWPLGEAIRAAPGDPAAWSRDLARRGVSLVLLNWVELARLSRTGWADPVVTPGAVDAWLKSGVRVIREWPEIGAILVEIPVGPKESLP
jgi:hypothetical protein